MILRRLTEHVQAQNWFAVALDFAIVVAGVFLGIQIGNWNEDRAEQRDYRGALDRYAEEVRTNLEILDYTDAASAESLKIVGEGFEALRRCEESPEARAAIEAALSKMAGTLGIALRQSALDELTQSPRLLARQTPAERSRFSNVRYTFDVFLREAAFVETIPLNERMENNPLIVIGEAKQRAAALAGIDYSRPERALKLGAPVDVACTDNALLKSFYYWERWQGVLPVISRNLRTALEASLDPVGAGG